MYRLNNWHNAFGTAAAEVLRKYFEEDVVKFIDGPEDIAEIVDTFTTPYGDLDNPTFPFHWENWSEGEDGKITKKVKNWYLRLVKFY